MAFGRGPRTTTTTTTTGTGTHHADRRGVFHPILTLSNILVWLSSVIVMGLAAYEVHELKKHQHIYPGHKLVYILVIAVLTVAFYLLSFLLHPRPSFTLLFNLIFSYLWLIAVVFAGERYTHRYINKIGHTLEAFTFIAL